MRNMRETNLWMPWISEALEPFKSISLRFSNTLTCSTEQNGERASVFNVLWWWWWYQPTRSKYQFWDLTTKFIQHLETSFSKVQGAKQDRAVPGERYDNIQLLGLVGSHLLKDFHATDTLPEAICQVDLLAQFQSAFAASLQQFCSKYGDVQLSLLVKVGRN